MKRGLVVAVLLCAAGAVLILVATAQTWLAVRFPGTGPLPERRLDVGGAALVPGARALAFVGLAAAAAVPAVRGRGRQAVGVLLAAAGVGATAVVVRVLADPLAALESADAFRPGESYYGTPDLGAWPYVALLGALALVAAGALVVARGRSWTALGARYDAPTTRKEPSLWDALDRGDDPTT